MSQAMMSRPIQRVTRTQTIVPVSGLNALVVRSTRVCVIAAVTFADVMLAPVAVVADQRTDTFETIRRLNVASSAPL